MRLLPVFLTLLMSSTAYAADETRSNVFKADLSNPDLALAVASFEQVCLPFVLHKTELTRALDKVHNTKTIEAKNFTFQSTEPIKISHLVEPARGEPTCQPISEGSRYYRFTNQYHKPSQGQFSIFNGVSSHAIEDTHTHEPGEIYGPVIIPAKYVTITTEVETFKLRGEDRLIAKLGWNYPSQNHPGKSCEIRLDSTVIDQVHFIESFIQKDKDWQKKKDGWSQCVKDDGGEFLFTVNNHSDTLSLVVKRDDFYETHLCK